MADVRKLVESITAQKKEIAEEVVRRDYASNPELDRMVAEGRERYLEDVAYHLDFYGQSLLTGSETLLSWYVNWSSSVLKSHGVPPKYLKRTLKLLSDVLSEHKGIDLPESARDLLDRTLGWVSDDPQAPESYLDPSSDLHETASAYLDRLLDVDRVRALACIDRAVASGHGLGDLITGVFRPVQREIGRLWQTNEMSVAQEHFATAVTQQAMAALYPAFFAETETTKGTVITSCVAHEQHELAIRMVADLFTLGGWNAVHLGSDLPTSSLVQTVQDKKPAILAVSISMIRMHLDGLRRLVEQVRGTEGCEQVRILVGGLPFEVDPELKDWIGADQGAGSAEEGMAWANEVAAG